MSKKEFITILTELLQNEDWLYNDDELYNFVSDLLLELTPLEGGE
jgi:hypothetical protein